MPRKIRSAYDERVGSAVDFPDQGRTKQSFKDECDINNIMGKFQRTGLIEAVNRRQPQYGDVSGVDFREAMETVVRAQELFDDMPSNVRKRFANDPAEFLDFVNNPDNRDEAMELGLIERPPVPADPPEPGAGEVKSEPPAAPAASSAV